MTFQQLFLLHLNLVLFTAKASLAWVLVNYGYPANPLAVRRDNRTVPAHLGPTSLTIVLVRGALLAAITAWFADWHIAVGSFTFVAAISLILVRSRMPAVFLAEFEIAGNLLFLSGTVTLASFCGGGLSTSGWFGISGRQVAAMDFIVAMVVYALRGGTYITRGVLEKGKTLPGHAAIRTDVPDGTQPEPKLDVNEYNRGRIIGNIERLMLMTFVALQAYQALAFLITAKGLFRSKDLEQADFAEYFLVGTLISSVVAVAAGLGIQMVLKLLW